MLLELPSYTCARFSQEEEGLRVGQLNTNSRQADSKSQWITKGFPRLLYPVRKPRCSQQDDGCSFFSDHGGLMRRVSLLVRKQKTF